MNVTEPTKDFAESIRRKMMADPQLAVDMHDAATEDIGELIAELSALRADNARHRERAEKADTAVRAHASEIKLLATERDKLQAFKDWCHRYLDAHGVPHHPPGTHGAEGCRIGDRMDWLMKRAEPAMLAEVVGSPSCTCGYCVTCVTRLTASLAAATAERDTARDDGRRAGLAHEANEWADVATNGLQWLKNIRDGFSTPEEGIADMEREIARVRAERDRVAGAGATEGS